MVPTSYEGVPASVLPRMHKGEPNQTRRSPSRERRAPFLLNSLRKLHWNNYILLQVRTPEVSQPAHRRNTEENQCGGNPCVSAPVDQPCLPMVNNEKRLAEGIQNPISLSISDLTDNIKADDQAC